MTSDGSRSASPSGSSSPRWRFSAIRGSTELRQGLMQSMPRPRPVSQLTASATRTFRSTATVDLSLAGVHGGVHRTCKPDIPDTPDLRNHALSAQPRGSGWAHLGSNQGPLACEASALPLSYAPGARKGIQELGSD